MLLDVVVVVVVASVGYKGEMCHQKTISGLNCDFLMFMTFVDVSYGLAD